MKLKTLIGVVLILAALSFGAYRFNRVPPAPPADPRVGQPLVNPRAIGSAAQVRLSDQGKTVLLTRQADGSWRVTSYFDLPADFTKLAGFISDLTTAKIQRLVTTSPDRIARLEFAGTKIEFLDAGGRPLWSVLLGKAADAGGRFVRFGAEPKAFLTDLSSPLDNDGKDWADPTLLNLKADDVAQVSISFGADGLVVASRAKAGDAWKMDRTPAGKEAKADTFTTLLNSVVTIRFSDTADRADPAVVSAQQHQRAILLTTFNHQNYAIALGRKPEERKKPATAPAPAPKSPADQPPAPPPDDTIPAGPVYAFITNSDPKAPINALMAKRAFQVDDEIFTSLPQKPDDLFEPVPSPAAGAH